MKLKLYHILGIIFACGTIGVFFTLTIAPTLACVFIGGKVEKIIKQVSGESEFFL